MNERIRILRKTLGLTAEKFGAKVGVKRNTVSQWENGVNAVTEQMLKSICREYNVNEEWLRDGKGEMFEKLDRNADIARLTKKMLNEESNSFKNRLISILSNLSEDEWESLEKRMRELYEGTIKD